MTVTPAPTVTLQEAVATLHLERIEADALSLSIREKRLAFEQSIASELDSLAESKDRWAAAENEVRKLALSAYEVSGKTDKHPARGVEVKVFDVLSYLPEMALDWATLHRMCLALDTRAFEATAKASPKAVPFVIFTKQPRVQIATDLKAALS